MVNRSFDKLVLFFICLASYIMSAGEIRVVPVIVVVSISAYNSYYEKRGFVLSTSVVLYLLGLWQLPYVYFFPLMFYDLAHTEHLWITAFVLLPIALHGNRLQATGLLLTLLFFCVAWLMNKRTQTLARLQNEYAGLRDTTKELLLSLEAKNRELMDKQDYEISLATLNERNRIAREIHDHVGHVISSALLQIGALLALTQDTLTRESLSNMRDLLGKGLDSIRNSIHNLYEESVDLHMEVYSILKDFSFCSVEFTDDIESRPDSKITYCLVAIMKEALSNVIRHSNATNVKISMLEHPALYQLIIADNGRPSNPGNTVGKGIGLRNIVDRVRILNGHVQIRTDKGFEIFVSIPKGGEYNA